MSSPSASSPIRIAARKATPQTVSEEKACIEAWQQQGDAAAANRVVTANLRHVDYMARKYANYSVAAEDVFAQGCVGLMKALDRFDTSRGVRFSTYAVHWIRDEMTRLVLGSWRVASGPRAALSSHIFFRLRRERARLQARGVDGAELTSQLAELFSVSEERMTRMLLQIDARDMSLDGNAPGPEANGTLLECLSGEGDPEQALQDARKRAAAREAVEAAAEALDPRERLILDRRLLAEPGDKLTLADLGRHFGVSRERARQLEERARRKLQQGVEAHRAEHSPDPIQSTIEEHMGSSTPIAASPASPARASSHRARRAGAQPVLRRPRRSVGRAQAAAAALCVACGVGAYSSNAEARERPQLSATVELGALSAVSHNVQFGSDGSRFDYVQDGGQDVLFPFSRIQLHWRSGAHQVTALYQPLELQSQVELAEAVTVDGLTFAPGSAVRLRYSFPFYRVGYRYVAYSSEQTELAWGGALQVRNATIDFEALDGSQLVSNRDVGPVPLLALHWLHRFGSSSFVGTEIDGFYAPVKYINGGDSDVVGAIVDASLRVGWELSESSRLFANLRWLGGGAQGTGESDGRGDGYTSNWLNFTTLSIGYGFGVR